MASTSSRNTDPDLSTMSNILSTFSQDVTPDELFATGSATLQIWQNLLAIGGGGLSLPKCNTSVLIPKFTTHNFSECLVEWKTMEEFPGHCFVQPYNQYLSPMQILRIEPSNADKMLGLKMVPNGLFSRNSADRKSN